MRQDPREALGSWHAGAARGALRRRGEPLRTQAEGLGELAGEGLVADDERQLDNLGLREVLREPGDADIGDFTVLANDRFGIGERRALARGEPLAGRIIGERVELLDRNTLLRADGAADVHSVRAAVELGDVHVQEGPERRVDTAEPFHRAVERAEPQHERDAVGHDALGRRYFAEHRLADLVEGANREPRPFYFTDRGHWHPPPVWCG